MVAKSMASPGIFWRSFNREKTDALFSCEGPRGLSKSRQKLDPAKVSITERAVAVAREMEV